MLSMFNDDSADFDILMAAHFFNKPKSDVSDAERRKAKEAFYATVRRLPACCR